MITEAWKRTAALHNTPFDRQIVDFVCQPVREDELLPFPYFIAIILKHLQRYL